MKLFDIKVSTLIEIIGLILSLVLLKALLVLRGNTIKNLFGKFID